MEILLVDDHALIRDGLALIVKKLGDNVEVIHAYDASSAEKAATDHPDLDLVLLDYHIPGNIKFETLARIKDLLPATPVAIISAEEDTEIIREGLLIGASGFLTKNSNSEVILNAINFILSGGLYIPPAILKKSPILSGAPQHHSQSSVEASPPEQLNPSLLRKLTDRQKEVLHLMDQGLSNKEIAKHFKLSPSTIKVHVAAILRECHAENRTQAVSIARQEKLIIDHPQREN